MFDKNKKGDFYAIIDYADRSHSIKQLKLYHQKIIKGKKPGLVVASNRSKEDKYFNLKGKGLPNMIIVNQYGELIATELNNAAHAAVVLEKTLGLKINSTTKKRATVKPEL